MEIRTLDQTPEGIRLVAVADGLEALGAEADRIYRPSWVSFSWRGRVDTEHLFRFFNEFA